MTNDRRMSLRRRLRALLVLGRVSNLPTVWSNCLAAWLLGGGGPWGRFASLCGGATLLYTGGMFLNDAFDASFDRQYRPERPIPAGQIGARTVWSLGLVFLIVGWLLLVPLGKSAAVFGALLLAAILIYDTVHKRTALAPLLMATCRFLLYLIAASAAEHGPGGTVLWRALALAAYIVGLSYLARGESTGATSGRWSIVLLAAPMIVAVIATARIAWFVWAVLAIQGIWVLWCLRSIFMREKHYVGSAVAGLLAGIVLVDWLAISGQGQRMSAVFIGLFLLALLLQRLAPAT